MIWTYVIIAVVLLAAELIYFRIADKCNIIDKPNERSSHSTIVLRGGGIIFAISILVWMGLQMVHGEWFMVKDYLPFVIGLVLICGISFWDDVKSLPDSLRMCVQVLSTLLMFWSINLGLGFTVQGSWFWQVIIAVVALFFCVGAANFINFMDGINGITAAYSLAMLVPISLLDSGFKIQDSRFRIQVCLVLLSRLIWWWLLSGCCGVQHLQLQAQGEGKVFCR